VSTLNRLQNTLDRYQASLLKAACTGQLLPQDANDEPADRLLQRILAERRQRWLEVEWQNQVERAQKKAAQAQRKAVGRPHNLRDLDPADWQTIPEAEYAPYLPQNDKWQKKYKEPAAVETADLPDLPPGWVWATPEQLAATEAYSLAIGPFGSNLRVVDYRDRGVPSPSDIADYTRRCSAKNQFGSLQNGCNSPSTTGRTKTHRRRSGTPPIHRHGHPTGHLRQPDPQRPFAPVDITAGF
jgi:type I restriction enzyme, S subunit